MGRLGILLLKGLGVFVLAMVALSVIASILTTIVGIAMGIVSLVVTLVVFGLIGLALVWLASMLWGDGTDGVTASSSARAGSSGRRVESQDPESRVRSAYVEGELTEDEFERELDRVLDDGPDLEREFDSSRSRSYETDRRSR